MSLVSTLAKVAIGVVVAKGVSGMMKKGKETRGQVSDGGLFGGQNSPQAQPSGSDLEDMMSDILGNKTPPAQGGTGGLGGLLEQLGGTPGTIGAKQGGGLDDLLSQLGGGGTPTGR